jgi:sulfotransferase family protein
MEIDKPIFIIGSGRSGTTILYKLLSIHSDLCWFSNYTDKFPSLPSIAILHRILDIPVLGKRLKKANLTRRSMKLIPKPTEGGTIYHSYCGFEHARKTTEDDLNEEVGNKFRKIITKHLRSTGKTRFISKQTANNQRIRQIDKIFPNAYYIHIIRDGRAVANSLFRISWWDDVDIWWLGHRASKWYEMGKEPIELCGLQWKRDVMELLENKHLFEDRYIEIRYEDLVENTKNIVHKITDFCELNWPPEFETGIPNKLENMNYKWKEELTEPQQKILSKSLENFLKQLGYQ